MSVAKVAFVALQGQLIRIIAIPGYMTTAVKKGTRVNMTKETKNREL